MATQRHADVVWEGGLAQGKGRVAVGSKAFAELPLTWAARVEKPDGKTSPEELIAAAHAGSYSMELANVLTDAGRAPERLRVSAICTLDRVEGDLRIVSMDLDVRGQVPGISEPDFDKAAEQAKEGCPVSKALGGNVDIRLKARLELMY